MLIEKFWITKAERADVIEAPIRPTRLPRPRKAESIFIFN